MIDIGLVLPTRVGPRTKNFEDLLSLAETVDSLSEWDHLWVTDSVISLPFYDSVVLLAACAARTTRVRLGVACAASLGLRHPLIVAQQWANLDALSAGRMTFVACPGEASGTSREKELTAFSMTHLEKVDRMEESVEFLRAASAEGSVTFSGKYLAINELMLTPSFVQRPLPIWVAGNPPDTASERNIDRVLHRVARLGDGWMTFAVTPDLLEQRLQRLNGLREEIGRTGELPVCVYLNININPDGDRALTEAISVWQRQSTRNVTPEKLMSVAAIGTPEQGADFIGQLVAAGATQVALEVLSDDTQDQIELITEHLLPLL